MTRCRALGLLAVALALLSILAACGGSDEAEDAGASVAGDANADGAAESVNLDLDLEDVAGFETVDRRGALLGELGGPDAFVVKADEIAGEVSRLESWTYYAAGSQIDLLDGEILWTAEVDDLPNGSWLPLAYTPLEFTLLAGVDDTLAALPGADLRSLPDVAAEFEVAGAEVWAGEQLVLVFVEDALVYVEAFALAPGQPGEPA